MDTAEKDIEAGTPGEFARLHRIGKRPRRTNFAAQGDSYMTSFKRWLGAGAIVLVALAVLACESTTPVKLTATGSMSTMTFEHDDKASRTVADLGRFFENEDDSTKYEAAPAAIAKVSGTTLTVTPGDAGTRTVTVTATKGDQTATQSFDVTVKAAPPPSELEASGSISPMMFDHDDTMPRTVADLGRFFENEDDSTTYMAAPAAIASVSDTTLTITPGDAGTTTVMVTATKGDQTATQSFDVIVKAAPPPSTLRTSGTIPDETFDHDDKTPRMVTDLGKYFENEDDSTTYDATPAAIASVSDTTLTITPGDAGTTTVMVTATKGDQTATQSFMVTVKVDNEDPVARTSRPLEPVSYKDFRIGAEKTYTLSDHFYDPDVGDTLTYDAESDKPNVVSATTPDANGLFTLKAVAVGDAVITVSATDQHGAKAEQDFNVGVGSNAPTTTSVSDVVNLGLLDANKTTTRDLNVHFSDPESDTLMFAVVDTGDAAYDSTIVTVTGPVAGVITFTAQDFGNTKVVATAKDADNDAVPFTFNVTVSAEPNVAPKVKAEIDDMTLQLVVNETSRTESVTSAPINLADHFSDSDNGPQPLSYSADSDMAMIDDDNMLTIMASVAGTTMITVTASDGDLSVTDTFTVTVNAPRTPESEADLPDDVPFAHDATDADAKPYKLSDYFNYATWYKVAEAPSGVVSAVVTDGVLKLTPVKPGVAVVTVTPHNSGGAGTAQTMTVTFEAIAAPTTIKPLLPQTLVSSTADGMAVTKTFTLSEYIKDGATYTVGNSNPNVVGASEAEGVLTLAPVLLTHGTALVSVTPSNATGAGPAHFFNVTVQARPALKKDMKFEAVGLVAKPDATATQGTLLTNNSVEPGIKMYDLNDYVEDPDRTRLTDDLKFSATTGNVEIVAVYDTPTQADNPGNTPHPAVTDTDKDSDSSTVTIRARKAGSTTVTITATDEDKLVKSWTFDVTVFSANSAPTVTITGNNGQFPGDYSETNQYKEFTRLTTVDKFKSTDTTPERLKLDLGSLFNDPDDNDTATYDVVSSDDEIVKVALESAGTTNPEEYYVVITPVGPGTATVHFTLTDSFGVKAGAVGSPGFSVTVNSRPKAEGAQATTPQTLEMLSKKFDDLALRSGFSLIKQDDGTTDQENAHLIDLLADDGGYFSDADSANTSMTCRFEVGGAKIFQSGYPTWGQTNQLKLAASENPDAGDALKALGTGYIDVWCKDTDGESSPNGRLTIKVTSTGSIH